MFKDANPGTFANIYVVCGHTDLRYGIDFLAAIIEETGDPRFSMHSMKQNTSKKSVPAEPEITEVIISSYKRSKTIGERDEDHDGLPAHIIEPRLSDEKLAERSPEGYKEPPC